MALYAMSSGENGSSDFIPSGSQLEDEFSAGPSEATTSQRKESSKCRRRSIVSLQQMAENGLVKNVSNALDGLRALARYCCGGSVPPSMCSKVTIRWDDVKVEHVSRKIKFPMKVSTLDEKNT